MKGKVNVSTKLTSLYPRRRAAMLWNWAGCSERQMVEAEKGRRVTHIVWGYRKDTNSRIHRTPDGLWRVQVGQYPLTAHKRRLSSSSFLLWWLYHFQGTLYCTVYLIMDTSTPTISTNMSAFMIPYSMTQFDTIKYYQAPLIIYYSI